LCVTCRGINLGQLVGVVFIFAGVEPNKPGSTAAGLWYSISMPPMSKSKDLIRENWQPTVKLIAAIISTFANPLFGRDAHTLVQRRDFNAQHCDFLGKLVGFSVVSIQSVNQFDNYRIKLLDFAAQIPQNVENNLVPEHASRCRCDNWKS
jgi:hypothetical protein